MSLIDVSSMEHAKAKLGAASAAHLGSKTGLRLARSLFLVRRGNRVLQLPAGLVDSYRC